MAEVLGPSVTYAGPAADAPAAVTQQQPIGGTPTPAVPEPAIPAARVAPTDGVLVDDTGRRLKLRELTILQEMDLIEIAGPSRSENGAWMFNALLAARVADIDGQPVPFPKNEINLRTMLQRVSRDGIRAVRQHLLPDAVVSDEEEEDGTAPPPKGIEAIAKN